MLDNTYDIPEFQKNRMDILTGVAVRAYKTVIPYLISEFFSRTSGLVQKIDILDILCDMAKSLSSQQPASDRASSQNFPSSSSSSGYSPPFLLGEGTHRDNSLTKKVLKKKNWKLIL